MVLLAGEHGYRGKLKLTAEREDLLILERGDMRKGCIHIVKIIGIKVRDGCTVEALVVQVHLPHLVDGIGRIDGRGAFQLADLQFSTQDMHPSSIKALYLQLDRRASHPRCQHLSYQRTQAQCIAVVWMSSNAVCEPYKHWQSSEMQWVGMGQQDSIQVPRHVFERAQQLL